MPCGHGLRHGAALTPTAQRSLNLSQPWVRFISVLNFVGVGLMVLIAVGIFATSAIGSFPPMREGAFGSTAGAIGGALLGLFYLALAGLYVAPGLFLFRYASAINLLKTGCTAERLEDTIKHQKSFWRYVGIFSVIALVIGFVFIVAAVFIGLFLATRR
jgi:hypothetical protein